MCVTIYIIRGIIFSKEYYNHAKKHIYKNNRKRRCFDNCDFCVWGDYAGARGECNRKKQRHGSNFEHSRRPNSFYEQPVERGTCTGNNIIRFNDISRNGERFDDNSFYRIGYQRNDVV